jgi:general secretion pathway protein H
MNRSRRRWPAPARGFTLIELLVVFAILGLLMAVVPIALDKMREGAEYRSLLREMVSELRAAKNRAQIQGVETRFRVDLDRRLFGLDDLPARPFPQSVGIRATVAGMEMGSSGIAAIRFLPNGGATGGSIDVMRASGNGTRLRVDWMSGRVSSEPIGP